MSQNIEHSFNSSVLSSPRQARTFSMGNCQNHVSNGKEVERRSQFSKRRKSVESVVGLIVSTKRSLWEAEFIAHITLDGKSSEEMTPSSVRQFVLSKDSWSCSLNYSVRTYFKYITTYILYLLYITVPCSKKYSLIHCVVVILKGRNGKEIVFLNINCICTHFHYNWCQYT